MDGSYYRHLKSVDSGERWYSYKPLQSKPLREATGDGGIVSSQTCETVNSVLTGHLEFPFLSSFLGSFCCKGVRREADCE